MTEEDKNTSAANGKGAGEPQGQSAGSGAPAGAPEAKPSRNAATALMVVSILLVFLAMLWNSGQTNQQRVISYYPDFVDMANGGLVKKVQIVHEPSGAAYIVGKREHVPGDDNPKVEPKYPVRFKAMVQGNGSITTDRLQEFLEGKGIAYELKERSNVLGAILSQVLPVLFIMVLIYFIFLRQMKVAGGGMAAFGKSRAKLLTKDMRKVTFANVAGIDEAKEEVQEIIEYLKNPKKYQNLGGRIPRGVLLVGPPGTGKTLLAKAIAGEANVPFLTISGSDFEEMYVGVGASRVRDMFEEAKKQKPCIIFIDEIDAVGFSRYGGYGARTEDRGQTLNALLVEMDGFETSDNIILIAATNRPDVLDDALLRPGRFDRQIVIDLPSMEGRLEILRVHARKVVLGPAADLKRAARATPGFSGADLANMINEAALLAARTGKKAIDNSDLDEARDKVLWGRERKSRVIDPNDKRITAVHEAGHALLTILQPTEDPLHKITIIPRGLSLGSTMSLPTKDATHVSRTKLLSHLVTYMGGRAAEELMLDDICSGARQDIAQATALAHAMVCEYGMSDKLGPRSFGQTDRSMFLGKSYATRTRDYGDATADEIDEEVTRIIDNAHKTARDMLSKNKDKLELIVNLLLEKETVDGADAVDVVKYGRVRTPEEREAEQAAEGKKAAQAGQAVTAEAETPAAGDAGPPAEAQPASESTGASASGSGDDPIGGNENRSEEDSGQK